MGMLFKGHETEIVTHVLRVCGSNMLLTKFCMHTVCNITDIQGILNLC